MVEENQSIDALGTGVGRPAMTEDTPNPNVDPAGYFGYSLKKNWGLRAKKLSDTKYVNLEGIVSAMQDRPAPIIPTISRFANQGLLPIILEQEDKKAPVIVFATCYKNPDGTKNTEKDVRNIVKVGIEPEIRERTTLKEFRSSFISLEPETYQLLHGFTKNPDAIRKYLDQIDKDAAASEVLLSIVSRATKANASDIHIEPFQDKNRIRFRVDGVLATTKYELSNEQLRRLIGRIKVLSKMNIDESRVPQDGVISFTEEEGLKGYFLRAATCPMGARRVNEETGQEYIAEKAILRIARKQGTFFTLEQLGYSEQHRHMLDAHIKAPDGIILVTGPTGSGKTTTLYSLLDKRNTPDVNIVTVEDPVEIRIPGLNQTEVNKDAGYTFSNAMRYILRHDPNVILIGESRDTESAKAALEAANTGHLVLTTVHANDAVSTILRLYDLEVDKLTLASSLRAVVAQRLVRKICTDCNVPYDGTRQLQGLLQIKDLPQTTLYHKQDKGCSTCGSTGYKGRTVVSEVWSIGERGRDMIYRGISTTSELLATAKHEGMQELHISGIQLALEGTTTISEVYRKVASPEEMRVKGGELAQVIREHAAMKAKH